MARRCRLRELAPCLVLLAGCSPAEPPPTPTRGRVVVAITIDWEGADLSPEGLDTIDSLRKGLGDAPITHFISAAYLTKEHPDATTVRWIAQAIREGDQLAVHLHAWRSLALAAGITPKLSPSFLTGTDELAQFDDGDAGFDTDLDVYDVAELRALLRTSRRLLETIHVPVSRTFRAGGYLGTSKVLRALGDEGYAVDSSAIDQHQLRDSMKGLALPDRLQQIWANNTPTTQPFYLDSSERLLEMPIAAVTDYTSTGAIVAVLESAHALLQKDLSRDVFVVVVFHLETASDFADRLGVAIAKVRERKDLADEMCFTTVEAAADLARIAIAR